MSYAVLSLNVESLVISKIGMFDTPQDAFKGILDSVSELGFENITRVDDNKRVLVYKRVAGFIFDGKKLDRIYSVVEMFEEMDDDTVTG